jgi:hypothetical protein
MVQYEKSLLLGGSEWSLGLYSISQHLQCTVESVIMGVVGDQHVMMGDGTVFGSVEDHEEQSSESLFWTTLRLVAS